VLSLQTGFLISRQPRDILTQAAKLTTCSPSGRYWQSILILL